MKLRNFLERREKFGLVRGKDRREIVRDRPMERRGPNL